MHHCFFTSGSWEGNAAWIRWSGLGTALLDRGHCVSYMLDDVPFNRDTANIDSRAKRLYVPADRSQYRLRRRLLRETDLDYVHLINANPKAFAALAGVDRNLVAHWDELPTVKDLPPRQRVMFTFLESWLRRRAAVQISCTLFLEEHLRQRYGVQTAHIPHAPYLESREDGVSPFAQRTFVYMGTLFPLWDHDIVFEAARLLAERGKRPPILMMGNGPDLEKWQAFVREHGLNNVALPGFVSGTELWLRLRHAHVLLFPIRATDVNRSRCPSKVFAYAQARRPVVTSRVGELPFMLGEKPMYIDSTPHAFADAMERLMDQDLPDVDYQIEHHTWADRADRVLAAIDAAAQARGDSAPGAGQVKSA